MGGRPLGSEKLPHPAGHQWPAHGRMPDPGAQLHPGAGGVPLSLGHGAHAGDAEEGDGGQVQKQLPGSVGQRGIDRRGEVPGGGGVDLAAAEIRREAESPVAVTVSTSLARDMAGAIRAFQDRGAPLVGV